MLFTFANNSYFAYLFYYKLRKIVEAQEPSSSKSNNSNSSNSNELSTSGISHEHSPVPRSPRSMSNLRLRSQSSLESNHSLLKLAKKHALLTVVAFTDLKKTDMFLFL